MKTEEIVEAVRSAGFSSSEMLHRLAEFKRLIQYSTSAEREKCTGTQEFVTLPREVVERAMEALEHAEKDCADFQRVNTDQIFDATTALRTALDQPQNHVPDAGNMIPAGWKLVPLEPTREMIEAGKDAHYEAEKRIQEPDAWSPGGFAKRAVRVAHVFQVMLDAAPQPPEHYDQQALDLCLTCGWKTMIPGDCCLNCARQKLPEVEQELVAWLTIEVMGPRTKVDVEWEDQLQKLPSGIYKLYTNPQPRREPLTNEQVKAGLIHSIEYTDARERCAFNIGVRFAERAHGIK